MAVKIGSGQYYGVFHTFDKSVFNKIIFKPDFEIDSGNVSVNNCDKINYSGIPKRWTSLIENKVIQEAYSSEVSDANDLDLSLEFLEDLYDKEVILDEYVKLETMKTVFNGVVPQISISNNAKRPKKMYHMESTFSYKNIATERTPRVLPQTCFVWKNKWMISSLILQ